MLEAATMTGFPSPKLGTALNIPMGQDLPVAIRGLSNEFSVTKGKEFGIGLKLCLETNGDLVADDPSRFQKGAEMFSLEDPNGKTVAVSVAKYYSWNLIRNQMGFKLTRNTRGEINSLSLQPFQAMVRNLVTEETPFSMVIELAYTVIDEQFRGQGLGNYMFDLRLARAAAIAPSTPKLVFTMSRGAHLVEKIGGRIFSYLLKREFDINGDGIDGKTRITGIQASVEAIKKDLDLPEDFNFEQVHSDSRAVLKMAKRAGMTQVGLFNDLSPMFAKVTQNPA